MRILRSLLCIIFALSILCDLSARDTWRQMTVFARSTGSSHTGTSSPKILSKVNDIYRDEFGIVWIALDDGLIMFDGYRIDLLTHRIHGLNSRSISSISGDKAGHLFFRFKNTLAIYSYETESFEYDYQLDVNAAGYFGALYVSSGKQILKYSEELTDRNVIFSLDDEARDCITDFCVDNREFLFILTDGGRVLRVDRHDNITSYPFRCARRVVADGIGNTWVCSDTDGLLRISPDGSAQPFRIDSDTDNTNHVTDICRITGNIYLISTFNGLFTLDTDTREYCRVCLDTDSGYISDSPILRLYRDGDFVFMGSLSQGVIYSSEIILDIQGNNYLTILGGAETPYVQSMALDRDGLLWLATIQGLKVLPAGADERKAAEWQERIDRDARLCQPVSRLWLDEGKQTCWAAYASGIARMDIPKRTVSWTFFRNGSGTVSACKPGLPGHYLVDDGRGLYEYDSTGNPEKEIVPGAVGDFCADASGHIWISRAQSVQYSDDFQSGDTKKWEIDRIPGMSANHDVTKIVITADSTVWLGTNGFGLYRYDPSKDGFKKYGYQEGLRDEHINDIAYNPRLNRLFVGTDMGLTMLNLDDDKVINLDRYHGFSLSCINSLCLDTDSTLYAYAANRIIHINSDKAPEATMKDKILVRDYYVNEARLRPEHNPSLKRSSLYHDPFSLSWRTKSIMFRLYNENLFDDGSLVYQYKLEGLEENFIETKNRYIRYPRLDPGSYTFYVKTDYGKDEEPFITSVQFRIETPFWKTLWFKGLVFLLILGLIAYIFHSYRKFLRLRSELKIEQNNIEQEKLFSQMKSEFTENITHEFRTPLTLINHYLESILMEDGLSRGTRDNLAGIYRNSEKLNGMIDEIMNMSREDYSSLLQDMSPCNLNELLGNAYAQYEDLAARRKIDFTLANAPANIYIKANYKHLEQAVSNLLSNAFKYTRSLIRLSFKEDDGHYYITVKDNGSGIREESIPHVFERFWTEDNNINLGGARGFGIGLTYAQKIVEVHGGEISVSSIPGEETLFTIRFNKADIDCPPSPDSASGEEEFEQEDVGTVNRIAGKHRVLIVEGNREMMNMLFRLFSPQFAVLKAYSGTEGLEMTRKYLPDIIICDLVTPRMNGSQLCREIKADPSVCHIPVIILSSVSTNENVLQTLSDGAADFVAKPFKPEVLLSKAVNILHYKEQLHEKYQHDASQNEEILTEDPSDAAFLKKVVAIVEDNLFNQDFDIHSFADTLCVSRPVLFRKIKALTGMTPNNLILSVKLKKAAAEMKNNPELSVASVASKYGFCSTSYFIKCFKKQFSETPLAYRNRKE